MKMYGAIEVMDGDFHYRESLQYRLTRKSFIALKKAGMPREQVKSLRKSLDKKMYRTQHAFLEAVQTCLDKHIFRCYRTGILQQAEASGRFNGESYIGFLKQLLEGYPIFVTSDSDFPEIPPIFHIRAGCRLAESMAYCG
ncbi:MAG: hypothetical protein ABFS45_12940, partial [Pseudomonadota bacterium]